MNGKAPPTHLDLFSGLGGFAIAAQCAGFRTVAFVERDSFCQKILEKHWPRIPIFGDICQFGGRTLRPISLLTGGFPCQPFSQAGDMRGKEDDRYLWPEMLRVIQTTKPDWIIGENVTCLDGLGLDDCISDLEAIGYEVAPPLEIPACAVGANHIRNRLWIVANAMPGPQRREPRESETSEITFDPNGMRGLEPQGCIENERGWNLHANWWETQPEPPRVDDGVPNGSQRRDALGNAIVPQIAFQIAKAIYEAIQAQKDS